MAHHIRISISKSGIILFAFLTLLPLCMVGQGRPMAKAKGPKQIQPTIAELGLKNRVNTLVAVQHYEGGNDMTYQEEWHFDSVGNLLRYAKRGFGGEHITTYPCPAEESKLQKVMYDDDGDILEVRNYTQDGRMLSSLHYIYAEGGALAAVVTYEYEVSDENVVKSHSETYYDKENHVVSKEQYTADAELQLSETLKYNRHGDVVKRVQTSLDGAEKDVTTEQRKYKYDHYGNWVSCTYYNNGKKYYTITRTITYY
jgi:hypothetical protein